MAEFAVRIQKNKNITLPTWVMRLFRVGPGDFLQLRQTRSGILLKPGKLVDPSQAYFWTKEWQAGEMQVEEQRRRGRVKRFHSMKAAIRDLDR